MSDRQTVVNAVTGTTKHTSPHGISCYFVPLDSDWGVKVYLSRFKRDQNHEMQEIAAKHGCGPRVGNCFNLPDWKYCFVTERVELLDVVDTETGDFDNLDDCAWQEQHRDEIKNLKDDLKDCLNWSFLDVHVGNMGWLNGNLVCIDFGDDGDD